GGGGGGGGGGVRRCSLEQRGGFGVWVLGFGCLVACRYPPAEGAVLFDVMAPPLITITRQYASGGSDVAQLVATQLGWTVIDNEFVDEVARRAGRGGRGGGGCWSAWPGRSRRRLPSCSSPRRRCPRPSATRRRSTR